MLVSIHVSYSHQSKTYPFACILCSSYSFCFFLFLFVCVCVMKVSFKNKLLSWFDQCSKTSQKGNWSTDTNSVTHSGRHRRSNAGRSRYPAWMFWRIDPQNILLHLSVALQPKKSVTLLMEIKFQSIVAASGSTTYIVY